MGWDISPSGVQGVLTKAGKAAEGLSNAGKTLETTMTSAAKSAGTVTQGGHEKDGTMGLVAGALGQFIEAHQRRLAYIAARTSNSLTGAAKATNAYVQGDLDMAADAQREALKEPKIDLPGVGDGKGAK
ncbi:hypothetical protein FBY35_5875 [Streptomyces sp. SLBN-118]|uniref:DUF6507 family protein n=1 Tax=Streptomyces sp. SLBN-118 TaxID=2768454 RepID=UPI00115166E5|nr:DUF6507 family protein [Streptomyces sp. SLBN-118]TQK44372.1 hypothetical protein FBY35_5875 [Streptomyces sp. SLBN-118]